MSTPLDIDAVVLINEALTGNRCSEERKQRVGGCLFFQDGNKRTALAIYLDLCQNNGIKFLSDQDRLGDVLIDIAANQRGITENTRLLFPD